MNGIFFEVLARDRTRIATFCEALFGWQYQRGSGPPEKSFLYVEGQHQGQIRGGIGHLPKSDVGSPDVGSNGAFYIMVDDVVASIAKAAELGGTVDLEPTSVDGNTFAEFLGPENNRVGVDAAFLQEKADSGP
jgi:predicted enzyme related to lactoylglutathione lyase